MGEAGGVPGVFREHFVRHNRQVLALTAFTLLAAMLLWGVAFFVMYWLALILYTTVRGIDARLPDSFVPVFAVYAIGLCILAWLGRKLWPDYFPRDKKSPFEIFTDFLLVVPRVTLAVWGNLSAMIFLKEHEMETAWDLLRTIDHHHKFSIYRLPIEIPDAALRSKVVFALQLAGLVELRRNRDDAWLVVQGDKGRHLARSTIKIEV